MSDLPVPIYSTSSLLTAAILLARYRGDLPYLCCRYRFDIDEYHFMFRDEGRQGVKIVSGLNRDTLVPASQFRRALNRLYKDFQEQQRLNGNPKSAAEVLRGR